jgi:hypothetical protein
MEELSLLLDASEPTNETSIRRIFITPPEGMPEGIKAKQAATAAIRAFFSIADSSSLNTDAISAAADNLHEPSGISASLSNGGTVNLKVRNDDYTESENNIQKPVGEISISNHDIAGYEEVTQIEFVIRE